MPKKCIICDKKKDENRENQTPNEECGHWMHYNCLKNKKHKCPVCKILIRDYRTESDEEYHRIFELKFKLGCD